VDDGSDPVAEILGLFWAGVSQPIEAVAAEAVEAVAEGFDVGAAGWKGFRLAGGGEG